MPSPADIEALVDGLSSKLELSSQTEDKLIAGVRSHPDIQPTGPRGRQWAVGLSPVSAFVTENIFQHVAVPYFANHWSVVCDFAYESRTLFHLLYNPKTHKMQYQSVGWSEDWDLHSVIPVGTTQYEYSQVDRIGFLPCIPTHSQKRKTSVPNLTSGGIVEGI